MLEKIQEHLLSHQKTVDTVIQNLQSYIYTFQVILEEALKNEQRIFLFGNGKNIIVCEYFESLINEKKYGASIVLNTDGVLVSSIANNDGYDMIFEKQIQQLAKKDDVLIGISTSGNSKNVLRALSLGKNMHCKTIGLSGYDGGAMNEFCDINLVIPSEEKSRIYEMHILIASIVFS